MSKMEQNMDNPKNSETPKRPETGGRNPEAPEAGAPELEKKKPKKETEEKQKKVRKRQEKLNDALRKEQAKIGQNREERKKIIRASVEDYKEELADLITAVGRDENHPAHELVSQLKITAEFLVSDENIELAKALGDLLSYPEKYIDPDNPEETLSNFFYKALEIANRGGHSPEAIALRKRMAEYIAQVCEDETKVEELKKSLGVIRRVKETGEPPEGIDKDLQESVRSAAAAKHGREEDGDLRYSDLDEFEKEIEEGEDIKRSLNKLLVVRPAWREHNRNVMPAKRSTDEQIEEYVKREMMPIGGGQDIGLIDRIRRERQIDPTVEVNERWIGDSINELRKAIAIDEVDEAEGMQLLNELRGLLMQVQERRSGFETYMAQYLTEEEKQIIMSGPEGWEEMHDEIMFLLTADPNSEVLREQAIMTKLAALKDYIQSQGRRIYRERGYTDEQIEDKLNWWARELSIDESERIQQHNTLRGIQQSNNAEESAKQIYANIPTTWFENLSGAGIDMNEFPIKREMVTDANRVFDQAAMALAAKRHRRWLFVKGKKERGEPLTKAEQKLLREKDFLRYEDIIAQSNISTAARAKRRRFNLWVDVDNLARAENIMPEAALNRLIQDPESGYHEDDRSLYSQVQREIEQKGSPAELLYELTENELKQLRAEDIFSPIEQTVFQQILGTAEIQVLEEADRREDEEIGYNGLDREDWVNKEMRRRRRYAYDAVRRARQHFFFSRRVQKINATLGNLPEPGISSYAAPGFENEIRNMHFLLTMLQRFEDYGLPVVEEFSSLVRLSGLHFKNAEELRIAHTDEWKAMRAEAMLVEEDGKPKTREGLMDIIDYFKKETGIHYHLALETPFIDQRGNYDVSLWRGELALLEPIEEVLELMYRLQPLGSEERFEYILGFQFGAAGSLNKEEVERVAHGFANLEFLLNRIRSEAELVEQINYQGRNEDVLRAIRHIQDRFTDDEGEGYDEGRESLQRMLELIREGDTIAVQEFYEGKAEDERDKKLAKAFKEVIVRELTAERRRYILEQLDNRMPTVVAFYFTEDVDREFERLLSENGAMQEEMGIDDSESIRNNSEFNIRKEEIWAGLEKALYAIQNDIVRGKVENGRVDDIFEERIDIYLRKFLGEDVRIEEDGVIRIELGDYSKYGEVCKDMTSFLRNYFELMKEGRVGRAGELLRAGEVNLQEASLIGRKQFDIDARMGGLLNMTMTLGDVPWEDAEFPNWGSQAANARINGEFAGGVAANHIMEQILTGIHKQKFEDIAGQISELIGNTSGWMGAGKAIAIGESFVEGWLEMIKAPKLLENVPELEPVARFLMESGISDRLKKIAWDSASRMVRVTGNPEGPILQKHELDEIFAMLQSLDAFLQRPEVLEGLREKYHTTRPELRSYAFRRVMPFVALSLIGLYLAFALNEARKAVGEE